MKKENNQSTSQVNPAQYGYPLMYQQEDEIDLYEVFSSIFSQWRLLLSITLGGTFLAIIYALFMSPQYDVTVKIAKPTKERIKAINTNGFEGVSAEQIYVKYFAQLRSAENLKKYLKTDSVYEKLFSAEGGDLSEDDFFSIIYHDFETEFINPRLDKGSNQEPAPDLVALKITGQNEEGLVKLLNGYVSYTNTGLLEQIKQQGKYSLSLELEKTRRIISELRLDAKVRRELLIAKLEEQNKQKIDELELEKELLLVKASKDKESRIAKLKEAHTIAKTMGIHKITTIDALATESKDAKTMVSLGGKNNRLDALMGTVYLGSELEMLQNRRDDELFLTEISAINKSIEILKQDKKLLSLKQRKSDDAYLAELPGLLKQQNRLQQVSFDFSGVQLYRLDKAASVGANDVKSKRRLVVAIAFVLSGFVALFIVLIVNVINKHKKEDEIA